MSVIISAKRLTKGITMTKQAVKRKASQKSSKGSTGGPMPMVGLRLPSDRIKAIDRKAVEYGGLSRSDIIKIALKKYGL